jgi:hypothetical protein
MVWSFDISESARGPVLARVVMCILGNPFLYIRDLTIDIRKDRAFIGELLFQCVKRIEESLHVLVCRLIGTLVIQLPSPPDMPKVRHKLFSKPSVGLGELGWREDALNPKAFDGIQIFSPYRIGGDRGTKLLRYFSGNNPSS